MFLWNIKWPYLEREKAGHKRIHYLNTAIKKTNIYPHCLYLQLLDEQITVSDVDPPTSLTSCLYRGGQSLWKRGCPGRRSLYGTLLIITVNRRISIFFFLWLISSVSIKEVESMKFYPNVTFAEILPDENSWRRYLLRHCQPRRVSPAKCCQHNSSIWPVKGMFGNDSICSFINS